MNKSRPIRVLVFGFINMNVIDGSAFFISSLASMLATDSDVHVDVLLANPVRRTLVYRELLEQKNVRVIDPFSMRTTPFSRLTHGGSLTHETASEVIAAVAETTEYDLVILRSTEVGAFIAANHPQLANKTMLYVTGVVSSRLGVSPQLASSLSRCVDAGMGLLCQTPEMLEVVSAVVGSGPNVICLPPMIPDMSVNLTSSEDYEACATRFVYTGKFAREWNPLEIISGFAEVRYDIPAISLTVAGDQFKRNVSDALFVQKVKYALQSTEGVEWVGGVERSRARELIRESDVGISWRNEVLDESLELSTKLLEYGSLRRPCIMNRTPMHERIFGEDYPLYANSMREFVRAVELASTDADAYREAALRSFKVSQSYTYSASFDAFLPHLVNHVARVRGIFPDGSDRKDLIAVSQGATSIISRKPEGTTFVDLRKVRLGYHLKDEAQSVRVGRLLASLGPIVAFSGVGSGSRGDLDEVVMSRLTATTGRTEDADPGQPVSITGVVENPSELELLKGALQRAVSDLDKANKRVVVEVGAAHREFRSTHLTSEAQHKAELRRLSAELSTLRQERDELATLASKRSTEAENLRSELGKMRASKGAVAQQAYWRLMARLKNKR